MRITKLFIFIITVAVFSLGAFAQEADAPPDMQKDWNEVWSYPISATNECGKHLNILIRQTYIEPTTKRLGIQLFTYSNFGRDLMVKPILTAWESENGTLKTALWLRNGKWQVGDGGYIIEALCAPHPNKNLKIAGDIFAGVKLTIFVGGEPYTKTYEAMNMK